MIFYESGGRAYAVLNLGEELVPELGFHIPGKMGGVWFEDVRAISSVKVEGLGKALDVVYEDVGRRIVFECGEIFLFIPRDERGIFFEFLGNGTVRFELDGTRSWMSEPESLTTEVEDGRFKMGDEFLSIDSDSRIKTFDSGFEVRVRGRTRVCVSLDGVEVEDFERKRFLKEKWMRSVVPEGRSTIEGELKTFLVEMFFRTRFGEGFIAGLEEYPWWFSIDTSFLVPTLIDLGFSEFVKRSLSFIISKSDRLPPHEIVNNGVINDVYNEVELFSILHSVLVYTLKTGDTSLLEDSKLLIENAKTLLKNGFPKGRGMVEVENGREWLDVSSWAFALLREYENSKAMGIFRDEFLDEAHEYFERNFLRRWYDKRSRLFRDEGIHFTQVLPLHFGLVPSVVGKTVLERLKSIGMISSKGLKHSLETIGEGGYYGEKSEKVWWLSNYLLKSAVKRYDVIDVSYLDELFLRDLETFKTPPEIVGGGGCFAQSWSALYWFV